MALRNIRDYKEENTILRKRSKSVTVIDDKVKSLLDDLAETMYQSNGVGLAAPQVGILKRLLVVDVGDGVIKLVNPVILEEYGEQQGGEACLSIPDVSGEVIRPEKVRVSALNEYGELIEIEGNGLLARALCHEIDHLEGILFIDKMLQDNTTENK